MAMVKEEPKTSNELKQVRKRQNYVILSLVFSLVLLFYLITVVRIGLK